MKDQQQVEEKKSVRPPCHYATLPLCNYALCYSATMSLGHYATMHYATMPLCTMSLYQYGTLPLWHYVTMALCHTGLVTMPPPNTSHQPVRRRRRAVSGWGAESEDGIPGASSQLAVCHWDCSSCCFWSWSCSYSDLEFQLFPKFLVSPLLVNEWMKDPHVANWRMKHFIISQPMFCVLLCLFVFLFNETNTHFYDHTRPTPAYSCYSMMHKCRTIKQENKTVCIQALWTLLLHLVLFSRQQLWVTICDLSPEYLGAYCKYFG